MKNAPIVLVWTSTNKDYGSMHARSSYQNVGLFAVAHKMGAVVRGYFDKAKVREALKLKPNEEVLISMAVGYLVFTDKDDKDVPDGGLNPEGLLNPDGVSKPDVVPTPNGISKPDGVPTPDGVLKPEGVPTSEGVPTPELKAPELKSNNPVQAPVPSQAEGALPDAPKTQSSEASKDLNNPVQAPVSSQEEGALSNTPKTQSSEASKDLKVAS